MRRILAVRKGWLVGAVALVALVVAGAIQASVGKVSEDRVAGLSQGAARTTGGPTAVAADAAGRSSSSSSPSVGKAEIAPVPPDGGPTPVVPGSPRVVRTADLRVKVAEGGFGAAFERVASVAAANGGFVSSSSTASTDQEARSGELTVRVPADRFDSVRQTLGELGRVESQSIRGEDVSGQLVDYEARLKSLRAQEEALRVLVGQAKAVGDVLQVQSSLFSVRQEIEQLQAQKANLEQATSLATIQVSLFEPGAPAGFRPGAEDPSLARSFEEAVDGMVAVVGGMIVVLGYMVPIVVLGLAGWGGSRLLRRRSISQAPAVSS